MKARHAGAGRPWPAPAALLTLALLGCTHPLGAPPATSGPMPPPAPPLVTVRRPPRPPGTPVRLRIPALGVDAPVEPVGLASDGAMGVPGDGQAVGWFQSGVRPGEPGNSLLDGHVDWKGTTAVFWRLREVNPGDSIEVRGSDGRVQRFQVAWVRSVPAETGDLGPIFGPTAGPDLTLITCTGNFDHDRHEYTQRFVVRAHLIEGEMTEEGKS